MRIKLNLIIYFLAIATSSLPLSSQNPEWLDLLNRGEKAYQNKNYNQALSYYKQAIEKGDSVVSPFQAGMLLAQGSEDFKSNISEAIDLMKLAERNGNFDAMVFLGDLYYHGVGVTQNNYIAVDYYYKASQLNHPDGQYKLALMYLDGEGIPTNITKGLELLQKAADNGSPGAMDAFAVIYGYGKYGVQSDEKKFAEWSRKGAEAGDAQAQYRMGLINLHGIGGYKQNKYEAVKWLEKSANQGYELAIIKLAEINR